MIAQHRTFFCQALIVGSNRAAFTTRAKVLAGIKTECSCLAYRTCGQPSILLLREILCTVRLTSILNHDQVVLFCDFNDRIHVGHLTVEMNRYHSCDGLPEQLMNVPSGCWIKRALRLKILA